MLNVAESHGISASVINERIDVRNVMEFHYVNMIVEGNNVKNVKEVLHNIIRYKLIIRPIRSIICEGGPSQYSGQYVNTI